MKDDIRAYWLSETKRVTWGPRAIPFEIVDVYDRLADEDRSDVHEILGEWMTSDDEDLRFLATFLIRERHIVSLRAPVERALEAAKNRTDHEAKYQVKKLLRVIDKLNRSSRGT